jgi:hypothetical protein
MTTFERLIPKSYFAYIKREDKKDELIETQLSQSNYNQNDIENKLNDCKINDNDNDDNNNNDDDDINKRHSQIFGLKINKVTQSVLQQTNINNYATLPPPSSNNNDQSVVSDQKNSSCNEEQFWKIIGLLGWRNKSDGEAKLHHIQRNLKTQEIAYLKQHIDTYASHIEDNLKKYGWLSKASTTQIKNFTYHVVGLGQQTYLSSISDPEFIQFIWDSNPPEYQNLYDMLQSL